MNFATRMKHYYSTMEEYTVPATDIVDIEFVKHSTYGTVIYKFVFTAGEDKFFEVATIGAGFEIESMEEVELIELG